MNTLVGYLAGMEKCRLKSDLNDLETGPDRDIREKYIIKQKSGFDSQKYRGLIQLFWFLVTVLIGVQFYFFVYYFINGQSGLFLPRPPGVEGFLPISSLISLRQMIQNGEITWIHPAGLVLLVTIIVMSVLLKKSFCGYICPVGLVSESLGGVGRKIFGKRLLLPRWLDYPMRSLKYLLLLFFIYALFVQMGSKEIEVFLNSPYNKVSDVKMLLFFTRISQLTFIVLLILMIISIFYEGFWCRYLCPYGALLGFLSLFSPSRIVRNAATCIDCEKCSQVCPSRIKVHKLKTVRSDECFGCLACVDACPVKDTLDMKLPQGRAIKPKTFVITVFLMFLVPIIAFKMIGYWNNNIGLDEYRHHIENIDSPIYEHNRGKVMSADEYRRLHPR